MIKDKLYEAKKSRKISEDVMWESIASIDDFLAEMEKINPEAVQRFMKKQHEIMFGPHYNEEYANEDLDRLVYKDKEGQKNGAHWTKSEVEQATRGMQFNSDVTCWDKYVAFNWVYSKMSLLYSDDDILRITYTMFFDKTASDGLIWNFMRIN